MEARQKEEGRRRKGGGDKGLPANGGSPTPPSVNGGGLLLHLMFGILSFPLFFMEREGKNKRWAPIFSFRRKSWRSISLLLGILYIEENFWSDHIEIDN